MKMCPAKIVKQKTHFPITHAIWVGKTDVAYCDNLRRAELIKNALNYYSKSKACERYWKKIKKEGE